MKHTMLKHIFYSCQVSFFYFIYYFNKKGFMVLIALAPLWPVDNCLDYDKQPQRQRQRAFHGRLQFCIFKLNNVPRKYEIYVCV